MVSSRKGSSDYSCASSVTDEGIAIKALGVVARLMGLDHMLTLVATKPNFTPLFDSRSLRDKHSLKYIPTHALLMTSSVTLYRHSTIMLGGSCVHKRCRAVQLRDFRLKLFPSRQAKHPSMAHHKLFPPIKNHGFSSDRSATHIMGATVKILDPGNQMSMRATLLLSFVFCLWKICHPDIATLNFEGKVRLQDDDNVTSNGNWNCLKVIKRPNYLKDYNKLSNSDEDSA